MNRYHLAVLSLAALLSMMFTACKSDVGSHEIPIEITWSLDKIDVGEQNMSYCTFVIKNKSSIDLAPTSWSIHYNQIGGLPYEEGVPDNVTFDNPAGDYLILKPREEFQVINAGESANISYQINGHIDKMSETPRGVFIVVDGKPLDLRSYNVEGINAQTLKALSPATPLSRYEDYANLNLLPKEELQPFFPSPVSFKKAKGTYKIEKDVTVSIEDEWSSILETVRSHERWLPGKFLSNDDNPNITIRKSSSVTEQEGYKLEISDEGVLISANAMEGAFYGMQSLLQLLYIHSNDDGYSLPHMFINDYPRFGYRGMHLDVSRNFHDVDAVKKIINMMAFFKLNSFHFHITDDEGWRLEIPELPELTNIGSKRGYTVDEHDHLRPFFGSGHDPENSYGSGYYTKEQFIDILQYANARNIQVIPEIDVPGHARAAIISMEARARKFREAGDEKAAMEFLLSDIDDESVYISAQGYQDNVINICQEGAFNFMETVMNRVIEYYKEANVPLNVLHVGGDEIPAGAWERSPVCATYIQQNESVSNVGELQSSFFSYMKNFLKERNISMAGWEEIMLVHGKDGHNTTEINDSQIDGTTLPYVWNAVWGWGREDMIYKLANAGSPVIMSNSAAFYFDMAYDNEPDEVGLSWSGFADTKTAFSLDPLDMFKTARYDVRGNPLDDDYITSKERLSPEGQKNFIGIQAQLWSETMIGEEWLDYMMYPKMFGFAERAWSPKGSWMEYNDKEKVDEQLEKDWNRFANAVGQKGFPMLDQLYGGINYRKPRVGITKDGKKNIQYPGYQQ